MIYRRSESNEAVTPHSLNLQNWSLTIFTIAIMARVFAKGQVDQGTIPL